MKLRSKIAIYLPGVVAVIVLIFFVDLPLENFFHGLRWTRWFRSRIFETPFFLFSAAAALAFAIVRKIVTRRKLDPVGETVMLTVLGLIVVTLAVEFFLKPFFGRPNIYMCRQFGQCAFDWLAGNGKSTFPSEHAAQISLVASVVWQRHRKLRLPVLAVPFLICVILVLGSWHYLGDILGGVLIGLFLADLLVALSRTKTYAGLLTLDTYRSG